MLLLQPQPLGLPIPGTPDATQSGAEIGFGLVQDTIQTAADIAAGWNIIWVSAINPNDSPLWSAMVELGYLLAAGSILFVAFTQGDQILKRQSWSEVVSLFIWPLVVAFFLAGNGRTLTQSIMLMRNVGYYQVQQVLNAQLADLTFRDAISRTSISAIAKQEIETVYSECQGMVGADLNQCLQEKQPVAQQILTEAETIAGIPLTGLRRYIDGLTGVIPGAQLFNLANIFRGNVLNLLRTLLWALQWAFVNCLEVSLLLTALFCPIALGLSLIPAHGKPIIAWFSGFLALFGAQLGYNIIVGLIATVMVVRNAESLPDLGLIAFLSLFAPALALLVAGGGGIALFQGVSRQSKHVFDFASGLVGVSGRTVIKLVSR